MKKTVSINLNGLLFNIDDDACKKLEEYISRIESHFSKQEDSHDIMNDIEARISELLNERLGNTKTVISIQDIEEIIKIMGEPYEFADTQEKQTTGSYYSRHRRVYRDPDNRVLGGVCGGLGAYLSVDPVVIRIVFVIVFFGFGVGLLIYLLLWIVIPEAKTTAQKLEMRGDPVNASNLGNFMRNEFENVKNSFKGRKRHKNM